jgi:VCBS repeat-containing protein
MLEELRAEPRKETLDVNIAQVRAAEASLKLVKETLEKTQAAYAIDPGTVSKDTLDTAVNTAAVAQQTLDVTQKQYTLTKAGAWSYDINNQEKQYLALEKAYNASHERSRSFIVGGCRGDRARGSVAIFPNAHNEPGNHVFQSFHHRDSWDHEQGLYRHRIRSSLHRIVGT